MIRTLSRALDLPVVLREGRLSVRGLRRGVQALKNHQREDTKEELGAFSTSNTRNASSTMLQYSSRKVLDTWSFPVPFP
jgi:hypothetical protein